MRHVCRRLHVEQVEFQEAIALMTTPDTLPSIVEKQDEFDRVLRVCARTPQDRP